MKQMLAYTEAAGKACRTRRQSELTLAQRDGSRLAVQKKISASVGIFRYPDSPCETIAPRLFVD
jgi:hypothetical protein